MMLPTCRQPHIRNYKLWQIYNLGDRKNNFKNGGGILGEGQKWEHGVAQFWSFSQK
jgi:hypothetical protein